MRSQTDAAPHALKAQPYGDVLRVVRSMHPQASRLDLIIDAEAAVAESARLLENLVRTHQQNVDRLNMLRQRHQLAPHPVPEPVKVAVATGGDLIGRVIDRDPLTDSSKTTGTLLLPSGDEIRWTAAASYVDALDVLFNGLPIQAAGVFADDDSFSIQGVTPAPRPYWRDDEDYAEYADLGGMTVMATGLLKKDLREAHGDDCHQCTRTIRKSVKAAVVYLSEGPVLFCRPCKQEWNDAGRPLTVKSVTA